MKKFLNTVEGFHQKQVYNRLCISLYKEFIQLVNTNSFMAFESNIKFEELVKDTNPYFASIKNKAKKRMSQMQQMEELEKVSADKIKNMRNKGGVSVEETPKGAYFL